jgi:hypothetical protein
MTQLRSVRVQSNTTGTIDQPSSTPSRVDRQSQTLLVCEKVHASRS